MRSSSLSKLGQVIAPADESSMTNSAEKQSQIKVLIALGKEKGFLTYAEVSDHLPEVVDSEQIDDVISMIQTMGIQVHDEAPDEESQLFSEPAVVASAEEEEDAAEEAAAALAASDDQFGRTTDPVRMYMREMGSVELLDREGEIRIAKRIEEGLNEALYAMAIYPETVKILLDAYDSVGEGKRRLAEVITGFFDPNAEPVSEVPPVVELAEEIFHMPVRLATPQYVTGLSDVVSNPVHATGVGLLLYGSQADSSRKTTATGGGDSLMGRIQSWFRGEF